MMRRSPIASVYRTPSHNLPPCFPCCIVITGIPDWLLVACLPGRKLVTSYPYDIDILRRRRWPLAHIEYESPAQPWDIDDRHSISIAPTEYVALFALFAVTFTRQVRGSTVEAETLAVTVFPG